jgi:hypothetical protein
MTDPVRPAFHGFEQIPLREVRELSCGEVQPDFAAIVREIESRP